MQDSQFTSKMMRADDTNFLGQTLQSMKVDLSMPSFSANTVLRAEATTQPFLLKTYSILAPNLLSKFQPNKIENGGFKLPSFKQTFPNMVPQGEPSDKQQLAEPILKMTHKDAPEIQTTKNNVFV